MTPSKDTLEATSPASETAVSPGTSRAKQEPSRLRSDAVSLEVPVKVHGSRVKDVVLGTTPHTEPFEEQTSTIIIFAQGGVLKMSTPVTAGQMMVVTNLKSGHDVICRVIKVRAYAQGQSYVEIEFTHRQAGYWGVYFPSDEPETANQVVPMAPTAPIAPPVAVEIKAENAEEKPASDISWAPASAMKPLAAKPAGQTSKPDSAFAPIGSQEDVQPAASSTSKLKTSSIVDSDSKTLSFEASKKSSVLDFPAAVPASPAASLSIAELQGESQSAPAISFAGAGVPGEVADAPSAGATPAAEQSAAPFGQFAANASLGGARAAREPFGGGLSAGTLGTSGHTTESGQSKGRNWFAIAAGVAALFAVGAGAAYYVQMSPFGLKSARSTSTVSAPAALPVETNAHPSPISQPPASPAPSPAVEMSRASAPVVVSTPTAMTPATVSAPTRPGKVVAPVPATSTASANQKPAAKVPDMSGSLSAHPTARVRSTDSGQADAAPALDSSVGNENGELPAITASPAVALPPPETEPQGPVRIHVGGALKPPRLLSSVLPIYPTMARDTGIEGDVVIDTTIDTAGNVTGMKVISGPPMLRQAALDALRRWKYEPSKLNGQAVPVQLTVTIKFHHQ